jgi:CBS domain-containing protein
MRLRNVLINRRRRVAEVVLLSVLVATLAFFTPLLFGVCKSVPLPSPGSADDDGAHHVNVVSIPLNLVRLNCAAGEFNDLASLWLTSPENSIRTLFHTTNGNFSPVSLGLYGLTYFLCMCLTTGSAVPAGLFIPSLLVGSAMGRAFGEACSAVLPRDFSVRAGTYALIGAAAILGGVMRMSLSLTVILLETTGNSFLALPIMIALISSRTVGDVFEVGIYDMMIKKYAWPVLDEDIDRRSSLILRACDVMISPPLVVHEITRVGTLHDTLLHCTHNGFPVVFKRDKRTGSSARTGSLAGYIQRRHLSVILEKREFATAASNETAARGSSPGRRVDSSTESSYTSLSSLGKSGVALDPLFPSSRATRSTSSLSRGIPRSGSIIIQEPHDEEVHHTIEDVLAVVEASATVVHSINSVNSPHDMGTIIGMLERPVPRALGGSDVRTAAAYTHTQARPYAGGGRESPSLRKSTSGHSLAGSVDSFCPQQKELEYEEEPALRAEDFNAFYPRFPDVRALHFSPQERDMWIDLRPYADLAPVTVHAHAPLERVHRLFSSMGLRHLLVINDAYDVVGMITRHDLSPMRIAAVAEAVVKKQSR